METGKGRLWDVCGKKLCTSSRKDDLSGQRITPRLVAERTRTNAITTSAGELAVIELDGIACLEDADASRTQIVSALSPVILARDVVVVVHSIICEGAASIGLRLKFRGGILCP